MVWHTVLMRPEMSESDGNGNRMVGKFRLIRAMRSDGDAVVWRAERVEDFSQTVFVKLANTGDAASGARVRAEEEVLAALNHRSIPALVDAGVDDAERRWFAMESAEGTPLDEYCAKFLEQRRPKLELIQKVLQVLEHAHQRLIVHGHLNLEKVVVDADGHLHVLGFGERAEPSKGTITTGEDIRAAGEMLMALLSGQRKALESKGGREEGLTPGLNLRNDLDAIVERSVWPKAGARYLTAGDFAADIDNYLNGRAVAARAGTAWYRAWRFAGRNRTLTAAAFCLLAIAAGGAGFVVREAVRAENSRRTAQARLHEMQRLTSSLLGQLSEELASVPNSGAAEDAVLARAKASLDDLSNQVGDDAEFRVELARDYLQLGQLLQREKGSHEAVVAAAQSGLAILSGKSAHAAHAAEVRASLEQMRGGR